MDQGRHDVTVIAPLPNRPHGVRYPGFPLRLWTTRDVGGARSIRVWSWLIGKTRPSLARVLENITFGITSAVALMFSRRPDVVIVESWPVLATAAVLAVCKARGIPSVNYIKDIYPEAAVAGGVLRPDRVAGALLRLDRWVCQQATCNVVISSAAASFLVESRCVPAGKVRIIFDWLDLKSIGPTDGGPGWRAEHGLGEDEVVFMFAGTLGFASRVDLLVDVAEKLRAHDKIRLVCVGHGPLKARMEEEINRRSLKNLILLPFQPRERVSDMQSAADVMLLTTSAQIGSSSVPSKLITYLAVAKPVICSVPEGSDIAALVQEEKLGRVVPPEDPVALADAITNMTAASREDLVAISRRARAIALSRHSLEGAVARFDRLLTDIQQDRGSNC